MYRIWMPAWIGKGERNEGSQAGGSGQTVRDGGARLHPLDQVKIGYFCHGDRSFV
jgi:hypothetical protein